MGELLTQLKEIWAKLDAKTRTLLLAVLVIAAAATPIVIWSTMPNYRVLYQIADIKDSGDVVAALDAAKIPYRLVGGGTIIEVPDDMVARARILLAQQSLPRSGNVGYGEIFNDPKPGMTREGERINVLRAMQGEIERTIQSLETVSGARVHLNIPKRSPFLTEETQPSASVTVRTMPGKHLSRMNVAAIQHLVAASVDRLRPEGVTIVDTDGRMLSRRDSEEGPALDYKSELEQQLTKKVSSLLANIVGNDGVSVSVDADVDFSRKRTKEEIFDPEQTAVRSEVLEDSGEDSRTAQPGGVAGANSNQPGASSANVRRTGGNNYRVVKNKQYEVNRTVVETESPSGVIRRLTVSVLIDGLYTVSEDTGERIYTPRPPDELTQIRELVQNAVGFNSKRGDRVEVVNHQFVDPRDRYLDVPEGSVGQDSLLLYGGIGVGTLAVIAAFFMLRRRSGSRVEGSVMQLPMTADEAQRSLEKSDNPQALGAKSQPLELPSNLQIDELREHVVQATAADPERAAEVIRAWVQEKGAA